jgi:hypothetical protein
MNVERNNRHDSFSVAAVACTDSSNHYCGDAFDKAVVAVAEIQAEGLRNES